MGARIRIENQYIENNHPVVVVPMQKTICPGQHLIHWQYDMNSKVCIWQYDMNSKVSVELPNMSSPLPPALCGLGERANLVTPAAK